MRRHGYRALLVDLDGTALDPRGELNERTARALRSADAEGLRVVLTTGRSVAGTLPSWLALALPSPVVCFNGLIVYDPALRAWLRVLRLPGEAVPLFTAWAHECAAFFYVTTRDAYTTLIRGGEAQRCVDAMLDGALHAAGPEALPREDVVKIQCFCSEAARDELCRRVRASAWADQVHTRFFPVQTLPGLETCPLVYVDLEPRSRGKAEAIAFAAEQWGIGPDEVVAVGDQVNDLPMLEAAGLGVAMGQAPEEVRRLADLVVGTNAEDGLARFVEELLLWRTEVGA